MLFIIFPWRVSSENTTCVKTSSSAGEEVVIENGYCCGKRLSSFQQGRLETCFKEQRGRDGTEGSAQPQVMKALEAVFVIN